MPRTAAKVTQADIARTVRAVTRAGVRVGSVEVRLDGSVIVHVLDDDAGAAAHKGVAPEQNAWDEVLEGASP